MEAVKAFMAKNTPAPAKRKPAPVKFHGQEVIYCVGESGQPMINGLNPERFSRKIGEEAMLEIVIQRCPNVLQAAPFKELYDAYKNAP